jgi:hypothetical protein
MKVALYWTAALVLASGTLAAAEDMPMESGNARRAAGHNAARPAVYGAAI